MFCPRCKHGLKEVVYEGVLVDTCEKCEGEWLDKEEILLINKAKDTVFTEEEKEKVKTIFEAVVKEIKQPEKPLACPRCKTALTVQNYAYSTGIIIDRCAKCGGLWLDKDELEHIQIVIEEYEKRLPQLKAKFKPILAKIEAEINESKRKLIEESIAQRPKWKRVRPLEPLIKAVLYHLF